MIPFTVNGKKIQVKSSWDDLTYGEYLHILDAGSDPNTILSILTGVPRETLASPKTRIGGADQLLMVLNFANKPPQVMPKIQKVGKYELPLKGGKFDIRFESLEQFEDLRVVMTKGMKDANDVLKSYVKAVAIYLQKIRDGEYDGLKAQDMVDEVLTLPCREVLSAGSFFILRLLSLSGGIKGSSRKAANPTPRTGKRSKKRSGSTRSSTKQRGR